MAVKKKKRLPDKVRLVNKKRVLKSCKAQEKSISNFFKDFEHYQDSVKLLISVQQCAFTSSHFQSLSEFEQEELQLRFPKVMELILDLGKNRGFTG